MRRYKGEFHATAPDGARFTLEVWEVDGGGVEIVCSGDGRRVVRTGPGEYLTAHPSRPVRLRSDDPNAP